MESQLFVRWKGRRQGPLTRDQVSLLIQTGQIGLLAQVESEESSQTVRDFLRHSESQGGSAVEVVPERLEPPPVARPKLPLNRTQSDGPSGGTTFLVIIGTGMALASLAILPLLTTAAACVAGGVLFVRRKAFAGASVIGFALFMLASGRLIESGPSVLAPEQNVEMDLTEIHAKSSPAIVHVISFDDAREPIAHGSGFFVEPDQVVTNFHVVQNAQHIRFRLSNGRESDCIGVTLLAPERDLAILRSELPGPTHLSLETNRIHEGEMVAVVGSPLGLEGTLSTGIVSALRRDDAGIELVQMSAPISVGSSGSPVINRFGRVIGVATMYHRRGQALNFAVSSRELASILKHIENTAEQP